MSQSLHFETATASRRDLVPADALELRLAEDRGRADHGWLRSAHSFSFASYYNPDRMAFEDLRVINDDWVAAGAGFPPHPHQDFEIFSYVLSGTIEHKDSMGNGSQVSAGGVQYMTAGSGVRHSEFNPSADEALEFLQIWLMPAVRGAAPRYEVRQLTPEEKNGRFTTFISEDGADGAIRTLAHAKVAAGRFDGDQTGEVINAEGRSTYLHVARGTVSVNGLELRQGDAVTTRAPGRIVVDRGTDAEVLVFDLAQRGSAS